MMDMIREQAGRIYDELWNVATDYCGLAPTKENVQLVQDIYVTVLGIRTKAPEYDDLVLDTGFLPPAHNKLVDLDGLSFAFLCTLLVGSEKDLRKALNILVAAAEALGRISVWVEWQKVTGGAASLNPRTLAASLLAKQRHAES